MAQGDRRVKNIYYGYGEKNFYFRLDSKQLVGDEVIVDFHLPTPVRLRIIREGEGWRVNLEKSKDGVVYEQTECVAEVVGGMGLQAQLPFSSLGWRRGRPLRKSPKRAVISDFHPLLTFHFLTIKTRS